MTLFTQTAFIAGAAALGITLSAVAANAYSKTEIEITLETPLTQFSGLNSMQLLPEDAELRMGIPVLTEYTDHKVTFSLLLGEYTDPASGRGLILELSGNAEEAGGIKRSFEQLGDNPDYSPGGEPGSRVFKVSGFPCIAKNGIFTVNVHCALGDLIYFYSGALAAPAGSAEMDKAVEEISAYAATFPFEKAAEAFMGSQ